MSMFVCKDTKIEDIKDIAEDIKNKLDKLVLNLEEDTTYNLDYILEDVMEGGVRMFKGVYYLIHD